MKGSRPFKCVFYAINGVGLGHITRQVNIAQDVRSILSAIGVPDRLEVLTTSDAPQVAKDFLVTKLPSKTVVKERGFNPKLFATQARNYVSNYLACVQPDVLVVDTDPRGSFAEIAFVRGFAGKLVFVDRMKDDSVVQVPSYCTSVKLYDLVVVPEDEPPAEVIASSTTVVGKIQSFLPEKALSRRQVREEFALRPDEKLVYLSAGGGGDPNAGDAIHTALETLANMPNTVVVVGYGPLYKGRVCYGKRNVIPIQSADISRMFAGFDLAVSAAGYNSHEELLAACVPTLFYAQKKGMDRQDLRIEASEKSGLCGSIKSWSPDDLRSTIENFASVAGEVRNRLLQRPLPEGNVNAARAICRLALSKPPYSVSAEVVDTAAANILSNRARARVDLFSI